MMAKEMEPGTNWLEQRDSDNMFIVGRLKPGVSEAQAEAQMNALSDQLGKDFPEVAGRGVEFDPARPFPSRDSQRGLRFLRFAARGRGARASPRLRQSGQSPARARHGTAEGNRGAPRGRREPAPA